MVKCKNIGIKNLIDNKLGIIDNQHSPLYYNEGALRLRMLGQLIMLQALDKVSTYPSFQVIALNTDSIDVILDKRYLSEYKTIIESVQKKYRVEFEHEIIKQTVYSNINNYIQVNDKGDIKRKGLYKYLPKEKPLGDSVNEHIIPILLELYFLQNINPWTVLQNLEKYECNDIYLFTKSDKISKDYLVYHSGVVVQNLNRYYCSNKGAFLYKKKKGTTRDFEHVCKDSGVTLFNTYIEKPITEYDINLKYYYSQVMEIINEIHSPQLQLL